MEKRAIYTSRFLKSALRNRTLRGDQYLLNYLTEEDDKKYTESRKQMMKYKKSSAIEHLVTPEGKITLTQEEVKQINEILAKRVKMASDQTENGYFYLHHQFKKLGQDL